MLTDDREEGEIIDDEDVFEDISDNTISDVEEVLPSPRGKSVFHNDRLRTLSLSSVSDVEDDKSSFTHHHHSRKTCRRKRSRSEKRNAYLKRRRSSNFSDEGDSVRLSKRLKRQLQEAIKIDDSGNKEFHHNSLKDRLQGMVKLNDNDHSVPVNDKDHFVSKAQIELPRDTLPRETLKLSSLDVEKDTQNISDDVDHELQELRLEALKTAILNKHKHRKKCTVQDAEDVSDSSHNSGFSENKENSAIANNVDVAEHSSKSLNKESISNNVCEGTNLQKSDLPSPLEEDEDALRALLLASLTDKMSNKTKETINNDDNTESNIIHHKVIEIKTVDVSSTHKVDVRATSCIDNSTKATSCIEDSTKTTCIEDLSKATSCTNDTTKKDSNLEQKKFINKCKIVTKSKIICKTSVNSTHQNSIVLNKNHVNNIKSLYQKNNVKNTSIIAHNNKVAIPEVKPLIINLNAESDSDDDTGDQDLKNKDISDNKNCDNHQLRSDAISKADPDIPTEIQKSVDDFLKQERAKVEAQHADSNGNNSTPKNTKQPIKIKSSMKYLPENMLSEYKTLICKLQNAQKKPRVRRNSARSTDTKPVGIKKVTRNKVVNSKLLFPDKTVNKINGSAQPPQKLATSKQMKINNLQHTQQAPKHDNEMQSENGILISKSIAAQSDANRSEIMNKAFASKSLDVRDKIDIVTNKPDSSKITCGSFGTPSKYKSLSVHLNQRVGVTNTKKHPAAISKQLNFIKIRQPDNTAEALPSTPKLRETTPDGFQQAFKEIHYNNNGSKPELQEAFAEICTYVPLSFWNEIFATRFERMKACLAAEEDYFEKSKYSIKEKYRSLSNLFAKITEVCKEQKKHELLIKQLLQQLSIADGQLAKCKENRKKLSQELVYKKAVIDKSTKLENTVKNQQKFTREQKPQSNKKADNMNKTSEVRNSAETCINTETHSVIANLDTNSTSAISMGSTEVLISEKNDGATAALLPNATLQETSNEKETNCNVEIQCEDKIHEMNSEVNQTSVEILHKKKLSEANETTATSSETNETAATSQHKELQESAVPSAPSKLSELEKDTDLPSEENPPGCTISALRKDAVLSYISPLGKSSRCEQIDPLAILCPYEISGSCRDPECKFTHFEKT